MYLPHELVEIIMHYKGAYSLNIKERPYIPDIKLIGRVSEYGVKRSMIHLREMRVLMNMYGSRLEWFNIWRENCM